MLLQSDNYRLLVAGGKSNGVPVTAGMIYNSGNIFTTFDQDNDARHNGNCAESYRGGWWWVKSNKNNIQFIKRLKLLKMLFH